MKKRYLIMLIIAIVLVLCIGAGFAFVYFFTDTFKSNKTLFFKYISQNTQIMNFINDDDIKAYSDKQKQTPYTSEGTIKTNVTFPDSSEAQIANALQNCNISFNGKVDNTNKYFRETIKANYSDSQSLEFELYRNNDIFAAKINEVLYKYLGIDNNNLKDFYKKMNLPEDVISALPNKIESSNISNSLNIYSKDDFSSIKDKYFKIITDNLTDDMFSKEKSSEETIYSVTLNESQIKTILVKLLESLKDDEIIINKAKDSLINNYNLTEETINPYIDQYKQAIQSIIDNINNSNISPNDIYTKDNKETSITIKVHSQKRKLLKTEFILNDIGSIILSNSDDGIKIQIFKETSEIASAYIQKIKSPTETKFEIVFSYNNEQIFDLAVSFSELDTNSVHENSELSFEIDLGNSSISNAKTKFVSNYKNTKTFGDFQKEEIQNSEIQLLNNAPSKEIVEKLFKNIGLKLESINNTKLQNIGLEKSKNPFIYYIPSILTICANYGVQNPSKILEYSFPIGIASISSGILVFNNAKNEISNSQISEQEIIAFNKQFEVYSGKDKTSSEVNALYSMTIASNSLEKNNNNSHLVTVNGKMPTSVPNKLDKNKKYSIQLEYDKNGYINNIKIN